MPSELSTPQGNQETSGPVSGFVASPAFWLILVGVIFSYPVIMALTTEIPEPPPVLGQVPAFELTDHRGQPHGVEQLVGRVWVADVIFTRCPSVCPAITKKMFEIQHRSRGLGAAFQLVSFTVDPDYDTPEVLAEYAKANRASNRAWTFLTGDKAEIQELVVGGLKMNMSGGPAPAEISHSPYFVLVDQQFRIRGYYDSFDEDAVDRLLVDAGLLCNMPGRVPKARGGV